MAVVKCAMAARERFSPLTFLILTHTFGHLYSAPIKTWKRANLIILVLAAGRCVKIAATYGFYLSVFKALSKKHIANRNGHGSTNQTFAGPVVA